MIEWMLCNDKGNTR